MKFGITPWEGQITHKEVKLKTSVMWLKVTEWVEIWNFKRVYKDFVM